jgi:FKBP-type peptidyl-prolyl cis-trans isomerase (trigger factor)
VNLYKDFATSKGFEKGAVPEDYVKEYFKNQISQDVKKFVLKFVVLDFLQDRRNLKDAQGVQFPSLKGVRSEANGGLTYVFSASLVSSVNLADWKKITFNPPRRKLYKDLDRQAKIFVENEVEKKPRSQKDWEVKDGDWVCFRSQALSNEVTSPLKGHENTFWMKIVTQYLIDPFQELFFGKKHGDQIQVNNLLVQGMPNDTLSRKGCFDIKIDSVWRSDYFCLDFFKSAFGLANQKEIHDKLVEVFSFRNDISQRRSIVEEAFRALFSRFRLEVPRHLVLRRQEHILKNVKTLPDYHVYKASSSFDKQVEELSERQLREESIIDFIAQNENIELERQDVEKYLNLLSNSRLAEFVYFKPQAEEFGRTVLPIREQDFASEVLREKVLNYVISSIGKRDLRPV